MKTARRNTARPALDRTVYESLFAKAGEAEAFLKTLANAQRLLIVCELTTGEACVTALQRAVGLSQSSLSQHLARLRQQGLVTTRRKSQTIFYSLADDRAAWIVAILAEICRNDSSRS